MVDVLLEGMSTVIGLHLVHGAHWARIKTKSSPDIQNAALYCSLLYSAAIFLLSASL